MGRWSTLVLKSSHRKRRRVSAFYPLPRVIKRRSSKSTFSSGCTHEVALTPVRGAGDRRGLVDRAGRGGEPGLAAARPQVGRDRQGEYPGHKREPCEDAERDLEPFRHAASPTILSDASIGPRATDRGAPSSS